MRAAGCVSVATLYFGSFGDGADNLAVGALLHHGYVLYRDLFSHHFPFTYYWVAGVVAVAGKLLLAVRLSIVIFQVVTLAITLLLSRNALPLGFAYLLWRVLSPFYLGNMVLYSAFTGVALIAIFTLK